MLVFQIIATLFILYALKKIIKGYQSFRIPKNEIIIWVIAWLIIGAAIWWPQGTDILAQKLGVTRGVDLLVTASLALLFLLVFKLFAFVHKQKQQMTELVRKLAIKDHEREQD